MSTTATELFQQTNAAILAILSGAQSARVGERSYNRADLGVLRVLRAELRVEAGLEQATARPEGRYCARTSAKNGGR